MEDEGERGDMIPEGALSRPSRFCLMVRWLESLFFRGVPGDQDERKSQSLVEGRSPDQKNLVKSAY